MRRFQFIARFDVERQQFEIVVADDADDTIYLTEAEFFEMVETWPSCRFVQFKGMTPAMVAKGREYLELVKDSYESYKAANP
jgi:hypothetical protein